MTKADDWEPVRYRDLPDWVKKAAKPTRVITKNYKTILYGDSYDYMVQYNVDGETLSIAYWRAVHIIKDITKPQKKIPLPSSRLVYGAILFIIAAAGFVFLYQYLAVINLFSQAFSPSGSEVPGLSLTSLPTQNPTPLATPPPELNFRLFPKTTPFTYVFDRTLGTLSFTTYGGFADFLSARTHSAHYDPDKGVIIELLENEDQNQFIRPFIEMIRKRSITSDDQAKIAISLVQRIPYNGERYDRTATEWYYPYETLHNNRGSTADKAILLAYILNELGFDTVLFEFPHHLAVGIKSSSKYAFYDTGYTYIEAIRPTIITYEPEPGYGGFTLSQNPRIIHLSGGKRPLDVSMEYGDAMRMKQLGEMGGGLNQSYRAELSRISEKYDLDYIP